MCGKSLTFCMLLLIVSSLAFQSSSTNDDNKDNNSIVREFENTKRNYDKKAELRKNDTNDNKDNCMMIIKIRKSQLLNHIVSHEMCDNITYIHILCYPPNNCSIHKNCTAQYVFEFCPSIDQNSRQITIPWNTSFYRYFDIDVRTISYQMDVDPFNVFKRFHCLIAAYKIFDKEMDKIIYDLNNEILSTELTISFYSNIVSMLCLFLIFLVYSILPELRNIHSFMLRRSISMLFIVYTIEVINYLFNIIGQKNFICVISALVRYFCLLSSDFWLSVMSFDMWWTFRNFWSLQRNMEQQNRKKFIYSTIAWGGPLILTIICIIMEFVPSESTNLIRPGLCISNYDWFYGVEAYRLYSFGPECICISSSICLSIYTALKIMQYEKDTTRHLGYLERQSFNNNKQWINLYLKLSIVLSIITAIRGIILIIWEFWLRNDITKLYIVHIITLMTMVQHIGTFVIFVCKKTTMQLLLKHLCQNHGFISKRSRQNRSNRYELQQLRHH